MQRGKAVIVLMLKLVTCKSNSTQSFSSTGLLRQWLAMLCKVALMPQRGSGLALANSKLQLKAQQSPACRYGSMSRMCKQHDELRAQQLCLEKLFFCNSCFVEWFEAHVYIE